MCKGEVMDIVERLREFESVKDYWGDWEIAKEAANEIERLRKKITEMDADRFMKDIIGKANWKQVCKENDNMREALKEIADAQISGIFGDVENVRYGLIKRYIVLVDKARAALKEGE